MRIQHRHVLHIRLDVLQVRAHAAREERGDERLRGLRDDVVVEVLPAGERLVVGHGERLGERGGGAAGVPGVDGDAGAEAAVAVAAGELWDELDKEQRGNRGKANLAEDERAVATFLAFNELMSTERHTLTKT